MESRRCAISVGAIVAPFGRNLLNTNPKSVNSFIKLALIADSSRENFLAGFFLFPRSNLRRENFQASTCLSEGEDHISKLVLSYK